MVTSIHRITSWLGHRGRECGVHFDRLRQPSHARRVVFCMDGPNNGMASGLRGYAMADQLRRLGWRTTIFPHQLEKCQRRRLFRCESPDIVVLQKARHALNCPSLYAGAKVVLDVDDADFLDDSLSDRYQAVVSGCDAVIAGSRFVADWARQYNPNVTIIWTGKTPSPEYETYPQKHENPTIIWACSNPHAYLPEADLVKQVMLSVQSPEKLTFVLAGVRDQQLADEWLQPLVHRGIRCQQLPFCAYGRFVQSIGSAHIGLAPLLPELSPFSAGKSFGKVLAYLDAYVACIASNCCDHPQFFRHGENGMLADSMDEWVAAVDRLVDNDAARSAMASAAKRDYMNTLTSEASALKLNDALQQILQNGNGTPQSATELRLQPVGRSMPAMHPEGDEQPVNHD